MLVCFILYYNYIWIESLTMVRTHPLVPLLDLFVICVSRLKSIEATTRWDQWGKVVTVPKLDAVVIAYSVFSKVQFKDKHFIPCSINVISSV